MSARVWTREELNRVHPLPEGWEWKYECDSWWAVLGDEDDAERAACFVWPNDRDRFGVAAGTLGCDDAPADVALAVLLASKGLDSMEAMAEVLDGMANEYAVGAARLKRVQDRAACWAAEKGVRTAVEMLRRGTVAS